MMSEQKYSLAHLTVLGCPPPEMTYIAARAGYDYVSIRPIYMGLPGEPNYALADNKEMFRQTKRALADTGVKIHDIELARVTNEIDPKQYLPAFEVSAELGATNVLSSIWTDNREVYLEKFAQLCDLAKPFGMKVDLEYVPIASVNNLTDATHVLRTVNRDNAGLMIDVYHFHRAHDRLEDLMELPKSWFHFAHLCDAPETIPAKIEDVRQELREGRLYVGEGGINIAAIFNRLPEMVYSIELPNSAYVKEMGYAEHAFRCLETAKKYFAAHPRRVAAGACK